MRKTIGIIGGAGVAATNKLLEMIENKLTRNGAVRDSDHPEILVCQLTQAPSRSMFLEGKGETFIPAYIEAAKRLKQAGATKLAMCCNTAHYAIDEIAEQANIEFINLAEEVVVEVKKIRKRNVGLIVTNGCLAGKVYEKYFYKHFPDVRLIYPDTVLQKRVTEGICNTKNASRFLADEHPARPKNIFAGICDELFACGAEVIVIGCTDIRVDFIYPNTVDSLGLLADLIIKEC